MVWARQSNLKGVLVMGLVWKGQGAVPFVSEGKWMGSQWFISIVHTTNVRVLGVGPL